MKRAIGIIRVSEVAGREGERFHSPAIQREIIERDCERLGLRLSYVLEELDVSGGKPLHERSTLMGALGSVEHGNAEAIVFAYRDRMDRSIESGSLLIQRMDEAGALLIAGGKQITHATHDGWRSATLESFLNEDQRRAIQAKMRDVHDRCVERGVASFKLPPGYRRQSNGVAEPDDHAEVMRMAFRQRARNKSLGSIAYRLELEGVSVSPSQLSRLFRNRFYLGELHHAGRVNLKAHEPLVTPELWEAVQKSGGAPRGRVGRSPRLLARLGVLHCACGGRMSVGLRSGRGRAPYYCYRCTAVDCTARATISADLIERTVLDRVQELTSGLVGRANGNVRVQDALKLLDATQGELDYTLRLLEATGLGDERRGIEVLTTKREARDAAKTAYHKALANERLSTVSITAEEVLRDGTLAEKRALVTAVIRRITVPKGRGLERVDIDDNVDRPER